jgi:hypothetical protein
MENVRYLLGIHILYLSLIGLVIPGFAAGILAIAGALRPGMS